MEEIYRADVAEEDEFIERKGTIGNDELEAAINEEMFENSFRKLNCGKATGRDLLAEILKNLFI